MSHKREISRQADLAMELDDKTTAADNARAQRVYDRLAVRTTWVTYELETGQV